MGFDVHGKENIRAGMIDRPLFRRGLERAISKRQRVTELLSSEAHRRDPYSEHFLKVSKYVLDDLAPVFDRNPEYAWAAKHMLEPDDCRYVSSSLG